MRLIMIAVTVCMLSSVGLGQESRKPNVDISAEAKEIHMSGTLFDGHNDLPWMMRAKGGIFV